jgi:transcriptional regulator with XRE-family HTH domain
MAKGTRARPVPKPRPRYRATHLLEWRKHRDFSQEELADRVGTTAATVSRLENGKQPYTQPLLELLAEALRCEPADIIMRPPSAGAEADILRLVHDLPAADQERALGVLKAMFPKTNAA